MVLLVTVRVPRVRHTAAEDGDIPRDGAIGHGEGAEVIVIHTAAVRSGLVLPEMVLLVTVRVPEFDTRRLP